MVFLVSFCLTQLTPVCAVLSSCSLSFVDYQCALVGKLLTQGRIYATDRNILFYSKIFGREKSVMIPFQQVKTIVPPQGVLRSVVIETGALLLSDRL